MPLSRAVHRTFSPLAALISLPSIVRETLLAFTSELTAVLAEGQILAWACCALEESLYLAGLGVDVDSP